MKLEILKRDIVIVGAGPAGLAAAEAAADRGASVLILDDNPAPGGQIWRASMGETVGKVDIYQLRNAGVDILSGHRVVAAPAPMQLLVEASRGAYQIQYLRLILATGARERQLPFPGWTLPGVTGAGGLQALVKNGLNVRGQRVVLAGSGPLLLATGKTLLNAGAEVLLIAEQADWRSLAWFVAKLGQYPNKLLQAAQLRWALRHTPYRSNSVVLSATGDSRVRAVRVQRDAQITELECDWLGVGYHLLPNTELAALLGCSVNAGAVAVNEYQQTSVSHIYAAGEATGVGGLDKALLEGRIAGLAATDRKTEAQALIHQLPKQRQFVELLNQQFAIRPALRELSDGHTLICRCEDVSHQTLKQFDHWREAKLQTRCGMGPCQGRMCGPICQTLYGWEDVGSRPPLNPTRLGTLAQINHSHSVNNTETSTS